MWAALMDFQSVKTWWGLVICSKATMKAVASENPKCYGHVQVYGEEREFLPKTFSFSLILSQNFSC